MAGGLDAGETLDEAADRELREEFGLDASATVNLRGFSVKQTRPVRDRSNIMHNFVALADENDWLRGYDVDAVNAELAAKRAAHAELVERGEFWEMDAAAREAVSPETHQVQCALPNPRGCALLLSGFSEGPADLPGLWVGVSLRDAVLW